MTRRRVALLDEPEPDGWSLRPNRFEGLASVLAAAGWEATLVGCAPPRAAVAGIAHLAAAPPPLPILTGLNHAVETAPLTRAHDLVRIVAALDPDLVIAPVGGGLAHGLAMARACGEAFANTRIALWADRPSRSAMLSGDASTEGLRPLVADALERATLARADALIAPDAAARTALARLAAPLPPVFFAALPAAPREPAPAAPGSARALVFIGRFARDSGAMAFIDAIESLEERQGRLPVDSVDFVGPHRMAAPGPGAGWMALRAASWRFAFSFHAETDPHAALARLARQPDALAALATEDGALLPFADDFARRRLALTAEALLAPDLAETLARALAGSFPDRSGPSQTPADWPALADALAQAPQREIAGPRPAPGVSLLVLHKDRPHLLPHALASAPRDLGAATPLETLLVDNGSTTPDALALLDRIGRDRPDARILRLQGWRHATAAYNAGAAAARHGVLVFLDDDNAFADDGVERLSRAVREGRFDVVVSTLAVFENAGPEPGECVAHMAFIGEAGAAGLFFNAFGDTAMAIRRDLFLDIGGFPAEGGVCPSFDWVMLARAKAAGARIGVLQRPAVLYRRDDAHAAGVWMKYDREHARTRVFAAYAGAFDAELVARFAQKRHLDDI